jgi:leader peptidase (prepilin peptidase)/N-methyltransferase
MDSFLNSYLTFMAGVIGLLIGSFLNVVIYRVPRGESLVFPGSHCTTCGKSLKWYELIPVASWVALKGRCKGCGEKISARYAIVETITAALFILTYAVYGLTLVTPLYLALIAILIAVVFIDLDHLIIPNGLVIAAMVPAVLLYALNAFTPLAMYDFGAWWTPLLGILPGAGVLFVIGMAASLMYRVADRRIAKKAAKEAGEEGPVEVAETEAIGFGDVKLLIPIGIVLGWKYCLLAIMIADITAGLTGIVLLALKIKKRRDEIPFGPFIVLGTIVAILYGQTIVNAYLGMFL